MDEGPQAGYDYCHVTGDGTMQRGPATVGAAGGHKAGRAGTEGGNSYPIMETLGEEGPPSERCGDAPDYGWLCLAPAGAAMRSERSMTGGRSYGSVPLMANTQK